MAKLVLLALVLSPHVAAAADECRGIDVDLTPSDKLQIVAWIEDAAGNYVDTAYITQTTGLRGLGNRTGIMDLQSGPRWPYGARDDVLPIWAHRHGWTFPAIVWQSAGDPSRDCNMSRSFTESSHEDFYCRPLMPSEPQWDAGTCASEIFTDKGKLSDTLTSRYPPRADVTRQNADSPDVDELADLNPFDTVSQATPPGDAPYRFSWIAPPTLPSGDYVLRVEVSKEFDFNASYTEATYPTSQCAFLTFGRPYRGQPSVLYEVPFTLAAAQSITSTLDYRGYSDLGGTVHAPDATITTDTPGSGASRLRVAVADDSSTYRVRVTTSVEQDDVAPDAVGAFTLTRVDSTSAELTFVAPGDDGDVGTVSGYDVRYLMGDTLLDAQFDSATRAEPIAPTAPGTRQTIRLTDLKPNTPYTIGVRAYDNCKHTGPLAVVTFQTETAEVGCGCRSADPGGALLAFGLLAMRVRRRRLR
jgi:hypothetical protein